MSSLSWEELIPAVTPELLQEITDKIVANFDPEKVILFGSHAWGTPRWDSDLDLFVVMRTNLRPAHRRAAVARACRPKFLPMDVIVRTPEELSERLKDGDPFVEEIMRRGRVLYER